MSGNNYQTVSGRKRLLDELGALKKQESRLQHARSNHRAGLGGRANEDVEGTDLDQELVNCIQRQSEITKAINECRGETAPEPKGTDTVQLGHLVTVVDYTNGKKHEYRFQLVGHGEGLPEGLGTGSLPKLPLISYTSKLGRSVIRKEVGDSFEIDGREHEITQIELPPPSSPLSAANAA